MTPAIGASTTGGQTRERADRRAARTRRAAPAVPGDFPRICRRRPRSDACSTLPLPRKLGQHQSALRLVLSGLRAYTVTHGEGSRGAGSMRAIAWGAAFVQLFAAAACSGDNEDPAGTDAGGRGGSSNMDSGAGRGGSLGSSAGGSLGGGSGPGGVSGGLGRGGIGGVGGTFGSGGTGDAGRGGDAGRAGSGGDFCEPNPGDTPCSTCTKTECCDEYRACSREANCQRGDRSAFGRACSAPSTTVALRTRPSFKRAPTLVRRARRYWKRPTIWWHARSTGYASTGAPGWIASAPVTRATDSPREPRCVARPRGRKAPDVCVPACGTLKWPLTPEPARPPLTSIIPREAVRAAYVAQQRTLLLQCLATHQLLRKVSGFEIKPAGAPCATYASATARFWRRTSPTSSRPSTRASSCSSCRSANMPGSFPRLIADFPRIIRRAQKKDYKDLPGEVDLKELPGLLPAQLPLADRRLPERALGRALRRRASSSCSSAPPTSCAARSSRRSRAGSRSVPSRACACSTSPAAPGARCARSRRRIPI